MSNYIEFWDGPLSGHRICMDTWNAAIKECLTRIEQSIEFGEDARDEIVSLRDQIRNLVYTKSTN